MYARSEVPRSRGSKASHTHICTHTHTHTYTDAHTHAHTHTHTHTLDLSELVREENSRIAICYFYRLSKCVLLYCSVPRCTRGLLHLRVVRVMECCIYGFGGLNVSELRRCELVLRSCCAVILLTFTEICTEQGSEPVHDRFDSEIRNLEIVDCRLCVVNL